MKAYIIIIKRNNNSLKNSLSKLTSIIKNINNILTNNNKEDKNNEFLPQIKELNNIAKSVIGNNNIKFESKENSFNVENNNIIEEK